MRKEDQKKSKEESPRSCTETDDLVITPTKNSEI